MRNYSDRSCKFKTNVESIAAVQRIVEVSRSKSFLFMWPVAGNTNTIVVEIVLSPY